MQILLSVATSPVSLLMPTTSPPPYADTPETVTVRLHLSH